MCCILQGRHHEYALKQKSGSQLPKPAAVKYLERSAAYQVVAAKAGGLVLWDCRAASRAVAEVATRSDTQLLQPMPGGTVLLAAAADGQVRRVEMRCWWVPSELCLGCLHQHPMSEWLVLILHSLAVMLLVSHCWIHSVS